MTIAPEVFTEHEFESVTIARHRRDQRLIQLEAEGYSCVAENLWTVDIARRVYVIRIAPPNSLEATDSKPSEPTSSLNQPHAPSQSLKRMKFTKAQRTAIAKPRSQSRDRKAAIAKPRSQSRDRKAAIAKPRSQSN